MLNNSFLSKYIKDNHLRFHCKGLEHLNPIFLTIPSYLKRQSAKQRSIFNPTVDSFKWIQTNNTFSEVNLFPMIPFTSMNGSSKNRGRI